MYCSGSTHVLRINLLSKTVQIVIIIITIENCCGGFTPRWVLTYCIIYGLVYYIHVCGFVWELISKTPLKAVAREFILRDQTPGSTSLLHSNDLSCSAKRSRARLRVRIIKMYWPNLERIKNVWNSRIFQQVFFLLLQYTKNTLTTTVSPRPYTFCTPTLVRYTRVLEILADPRQTTWTVGSVEWYKWTADKV